MSDLLDEVMAIQKRLGEINNAMLGALWQNGGLTDEQFKIWDEARLTESWDGLYEDLECMHDYNARMRRAMALYTTPHRCPKCKHQDMELHWCCEHCGHQEAPPDFVVPARSAAAVADNKTV